VLKYHQFAGSAFVSITVFIAGALFARKRYAHPIAPRGRITAGCFGDIAVCRNAYAFYDFVLSAIPDFNRRLVQVVETASRTAERVFVAF